MCSKSDKPILTSAKRFLEVVRVRRNDRGGLDIYPNQDSAIISSAAWADGVSMIQANTEVKSGDMINFLPGPGWNP